jgi:hypothetical protein
MDWENCEYRTNFLEINFGKGQNLKLHLESKDLEKL